MSAFTADKSLRNTQQVLTNSVECFINTLPPQRAELISQQTFAITDNRKENTV